MDLSRLPAMFDRRGVRATLVAGYVLVTVILIAYTARQLVPYGDWNVWAELPARLAAGTLYDHGGSYTWAWSPLAAWLIAAVVLPVGPWAWAAIHFAVVPLLRDPRLMLLVVSSYPFWMDTLMANTFTFAAIAGYVAWRGSRWAALAYLALLVLMPRPVQLPLAALILWRDRSLLWPFAVMVGIGAATTLASGYTLDWARVLAGVGVAYPSPEFNLSPTRVVGPAWLVVGIPLAIWLAVRKHPGWAGLAMTPYLVPQYLLILIVETGRFRFNGVHIAASRMGIRSRGENAADPLAAPRPRGR